jgi:hypothetical protein
MHYFSVLKLWSIHSTPLEPTWCLRVFRSISLTFCTLKESKLVFQGLNALFHGNEVANHPFYSIGTKMMFGSVSEYFITFGMKKDAKLVFRARMHYFGVLKLWIIHSTPLEPKWCLRVFWSFSLTFGMKKDAKLVFRAWMHYFGVPKLRSNHSTPLEPKWCLVVFWSISLTFCM